MVQVTCNDGDSLGGEQQRSFPGFPRIRIRHHGDELETTSSREMVSSHRGSKVVGKANGGGSAQVRALPKFIHFLNLARRKTTCPVL